MALKSSTITLNGQMYNLTKNADTGKYEATVTAPIKSSYNRPNGYYPMLLRAEDTAGNVTTIDVENTVFGTLLKLDVYEKVPPVIKTLKPGAGAYLTDRSVLIQFDVTDDDSGVNPDVTSLQIDSQDAITSGLTKTKITGGYRCTYTAILTDGQHTIKINAKDYDNNAATQKLVAFTVDTVPPMLDVIHPAGGLITNEQNGVVSGITNDATSAPVTVIVKLNEEDQGTVAVAGDGTFSKNINYKKGINTVYIKATDKAGKYSEINRTVIYDPDAPVIHSIQIEPNSVEAGKPFKIIVDVTD